MVILYKEGSRSSINHAEVWGNTGSTKVYIRYRDGVLTIREANKWSDRGFISSENAIESHQYEIDSGQFTELKKEFSDWNDVLSDTKYKINDPEFS